VTIAMQLEKRNPKQVPSPKSILSGLSQDDFFFFLSVAWKAISIATEEPVNKGNSTKVQMQLSWERVRLYKTQFSSGK